ncbi:MAG TPA: hypothetical protein VEZ90_05990 [Blastocatellia bacterium]|nr:hypothetical protein [Blastocatellia bacterium]
MAERIEGKPSKGRGHFEDSFESPEQAIRTCYPKEPREAFAAQPQTVISLSQRIEDLTLSLDKEI